MFLQYFASCPAFRPGGSLVFFVLCAEVEGHHHGYDDHHIIRCDDTFQSQDAEDSRPRQRDDGLDLHQLG